MADEELQPQINEVGICNLALSWLGKKPIVSLDISGAAEEWCRNNYPFLRDAVLEERMWSFARARTISVTEDLDDWGTLYKHTMPLGWLQVFRAYRDANKSEVDWEREEDYILSSQSTLYLWGVKRVTDTRKFSQLFNNALAARIAATGCVKFTEDKAKEQAMWARYQAFLSDAAARDGQQGKNENIGSNRVVSARRGY